MSKGGWIVALPKLVTIFSDWSIWVIKKEKLERKEYLQYQETWFNLSTYLPEIMIDYKIMMYMFIVNLQYMFL